MNHVAFGSGKISGFSVFTRAGATKPQKSALEKRSADDILTTWPGRFVFVVLCVARGCRCFCPPISVGRPVFMVKLFSRISRPLPTKSAILFLGGGKAAPRSERRFPHAPDYLPQLPRDYDRPARGGMEKDVFGFSRRSLRLPVPRLCPAAARLL